MPRIRGGGSYYGYDRSNEMTASKLKCGRCNKWKGETNFSNKQLGNLRIKVAKFGNAATSASDAGLVCRLCTGGQVVEKECAMCGKTKGLEEFAKVQRTRGDDARCKKCVNDQLDTLPVTSLTDPKTGDDMKDYDDEDEDDDSDENSSDSDESTNYGPADDVSNDGYTMTDRSDITSTTSNYSLVSGGVSLGQACAKPVNDTEDSWQVKSRGKTRINGSTAQSTAGPFSTSANQPYSYGHARTSSASTTSSANSYGKPPNKGRNAWAKAPKAPQPAKVVQPDLEDFEDDADDWEVNGNGSDDSDDYLDM